MLQKILCVVGIKIVKNVKNICKGEKFLFEYRFKFLILYKINNCQFYFLTIKIRVYLFDRY